MKVHPKRLIALLLLICMLATMVPFVSAAAETESESEVVNYGFDVLEYMSSQKTYADNASDGSGNAIMDADGNPMLVKDYLAGLYEAEKMNYVLESFYSQNGAGYKNFMVCSNQGHRLTAANEGDWVAFRLKNPGAGTYNITLTTSGGSDLNTVDIYLMKATENLDIESKMTSVNLLVSGQTGNGVFTIAENKLLDGGDYILVIKHTEIGKERYWCLTDLELTRVPAPHSVTVLEKAVNDGVVDGCVVGAVTEVNGHDYFFMPCEGYMMLIFDLTTKQLVRQIDGTDMNRAQFMAVAPDGKVWLCGSTQAFFVYDPYSDTYFKTANFTKLDIPDLKAEGGITSLAIADDGMVYFGTYYGGCLAKYDPVAQEYTSWGQIIPGTKQLRVTKCKDGYLYFTAEGDDFALVGKYNINTNQVEKTADFTDLKGANVYAVNLLGDDLLIVGGNRQTGIIALDQETFEFVDTGLPGTCISMQATEEIDGKYYMVIQGEGLYSYDVKTKTFNNEGFPVSSIGFRTSGQNGFGKSIVTIDGDPCLFTYTPAGGHPWIWNLRTREYYKWDTLVAGYGNGAAIHTFINGVEGSNELYISAYNTDTSAIYNTELNSITGNYASKGQTDSQVWYDGILYMGNYSSGVIAAWNPATGEVNNEVYKIGESQVRVHTLAAGDGYIFAGTIPNKNLNGGSIAVYNTKTGEGKTHRNVIQDQSITSLVYHDGLLYGSSTRSGGSGSGKVDGTSAVLFVYDYINGKLLATCDLREHIEGLGSPIEYIAGIAADPNVAENDRFWAVVSETLVCYTFDRNTLTFQVQEVISFDKTQYANGGGRHWFPRPIVFNREKNQIYYAFYADGGMQCIEIADWNATIGNVSVSKNTHIMHDTPMFYALGDDGNLYYADSMDIKMFPLNVSNEDWSAARAVDEKIVAIGNNITTESEATIQAARAAYENLHSLDQALVQKLDALKVAEALLLEAKIVAISNVTADSLPVLMKMMRQYSDMSPNLQAYVQSFEDLLSAYDLAKKLFDEAQVANQAAVDAVIAKINAIGDVTLNSQEVITAARTAYDALSDAQKALVNTAVLTAAEAKFAELKTAADKAAADAVTAKINAIGTVTEDSKVVIEAARAAYNALTAEQKALVKNASVLTAAEAALEVLQKPANPENPQTGDSTPVAALAVVMVVSAAALGAVLVSNIKRRRV